MLNINNNCARTMKKRMHHITRRSLLSRWTWAVFPHTGSTWIETPVMLLRNFNMPTGLCNRTTYIVIAMYASLITAKKLCGTSNGKLHTSNEYQCSHLLATFRLLWKDDNFQYHQEQRTNVQKMRYQSTNVCVRARTTVRCSKYSWGRHSNPKLCRTTVRCSKYSWGR